MRLAERLFAFWRFPAWTDAVQVLLWLMGWGTVAALFVVLAFAAMDFTTLLGMAAFGASKTFVVAALVVSGASTLVWFLAGCWFVSEAYRGWRAGHRHGRQWAILIGILLLIGGVTMALGGFDLRPVQAMALAVEVSFGTALLVACLTTKPPQPGPGLAA